MTQHAKKGTCAACLAAKAERRPGPKRQDGPREPNGRLQRSGPKDARLLVLEARAARAGFPPVPEGQVRGRDARKALAQPWMGCQAGRAIAGEKDVAAIWETISRIRAVVAAYRRAIGAGTGHPAIMRLPIPPSTEESFGAPPRHDPRDEAERYDAAVTAYLALMSDAWAVGPTAQSIVIDVICGETLPPPPGFAAMVRAISAAQAKPKKPA